MLTRTSSAGQERFAEAPQNAGHVGLGQDTGGEIFPGVNVLKWLSIGYNWVRSLYGALIYDATLFLALHARSRLHIRLQELLRKHTTVLSIMQVSTNIKGLMGILEWVREMLLVTLYRGRLF